MNAVCGSPLQAAKEGLRIPELWAILSLPGKPARSCQSPFREDRNPSFSIYNSGRKWADSAKESIHLALPLLLPYSKEPAQRIADSGALRVTAIEFAALWLRKLCSDWYATRNAGFSPMPRADAQKPSGLTGNAIPLLGGTLGESKSHSLRGSGKSWPEGILPPGFEEARRMLGYSYFSLDRWHRIGVLRGIALAGRCVGYVRKDVENFARLQGGHRKKPGRKPFAAKEATK